MQKAYRRIGISGGTFDPVHMGHLLITEEIRDKFSLDRVLFIPSGMPPHKKQLKVTEAEHRYNMLCEAVRGNSFFEVSPMEMERNGYTYTIDTLTDLRKIYGEDTLIYFITGADVIHDLQTWKEYERVFTLCEFIAVLRPGFERKSFEDKIEYLAKNYRARINIAEAPLVDISSTAVRERVRSGKTIKYLVPGGVEEYIIKNGLYRD